MNMLRNYVCGYIHAYVYARVCVCVCASACGIGMYAFMYVCMYVCMYLCKAQQQGASFSAGSGVFLGLWGYFLGLCRIAGWLPLGFRLWGPLLGLRSGFLWLLVVSAQQPWPPKRTRIPLPGSATILQCEPTEQGPGYCKGYRQDFSGFLWAVCCFGSWCFYAGLSNTQKPTTHGWFICSTTIPPHILPRVRVRIHMAPADTASQPNR